MRNLILQISTSLLLLFAVHVAFAQTQTSSEIKDLQDRLQKVEVTNSILKTELKKQKTDFSNKLAYAKDSIKILRSEIENSKTNIETLSKDLGVKIQYNKSTTEKQIQGVQETLSKNTLYWIIAVLAIALLSVLLFVLLRKQLSKDKTDITANIQQTKKALEEEGIKLDSKLIELLASQMQLIKEERKSNSTGTDKPDHSLALKIADEVVRIQMNLTNMEQSVKGVSNLKNRVTAIMDNFLANGYEIVDLLNKPYDQGMNLVATMEPDENLETGKQIIKRIIKPQINFKGEMIQAAQVVVAYGE
jgi:hypothetical protein